MSADRSKSIRKALDWGSLAPLRLRSRLVAEGLYAGAHKSSRRGSGIEFGGHREYAPGDDLRKLAYAALVAAALARVALSNGDPVGLAFIGGEDCPPVPVSGGREAFERLVGALENVHAGGDARADAQMLDRALGVLARAARRGSVVVVLSDLLDLPEIAPDHISALTTRGRAVVVVRVLDPDELTLPFEGTVRLRGLEGDVVVETDVEVTREPYLAALEAIRAQWDQALVSRGGRLVTATTSDDPIRVVRAILEAAR